MISPSPFVVYNASAGSGKTFTLVKEYLKILLSTEDIFSFQKILAITFTNKAAGEMKERVLNTLNDFSEGNENSIREIILNEITIDKEVLKERSKKILNAILQNYSAFSITTIDSFTHKIIKSFAYDLGLTLNFEVELDSASLLNEAIDSLLSKIGTDKELTKLLIQYSFDKIDDDKSWDISKDLNQFSSVLLKEDDIPNFKEISIKSIKDFNDLKVKVKKIQLEIHKEFSDFSDSVLGFLKQNSLEHSDFSYKDYPNHFLKFKDIKNLKLDKVNFNGRLGKSISESKKLYSNSKPIETKEKIDSLEDKLIEFYFKSEKLFNKKFPKYLLNNLILRSLNPLAVLNHINLELSHIKEENNIRLNAEFNQLISNNIKDQPAPFIYERLGQRFQNYFIDEMQDTSVLQWQNLKPLIHNALAQEKGSLLLVGDAKQSIYRWRGGKAEQFIQIGSKDNSLFNVKKEIKNLQTNYRSFSEVINFNNSFFKFISKFLQNDTYKNLFLEGNSQLENDNKGGFVSISFLDPEDEEIDKSLRFAKQVLDTINQVNKEFSLGEICILTRTKKEGVVIANYLSEKKIPIVSSETLLLSSSDKVNFIINILKLIQNPLDEEIKFEILYYINAHLKIDLPKNSFFKSFIKNDIKYLFKFLEEYEIYIDFSHLNQLPLYEQVEKITRDFLLLNTSDAYVQFFLDVVLDQQRKVLSIHEFLEYWELKKDSLCIVASERDDAVQIMTVHKSKGLEFPVVIFPSDIEITYQNKPKIWFDDLPGDLSEFSKFYIPFNKDLSFISVRGEELYNKRIEELELDNFNILYVALTRAVEQLHIITEVKLSKKGEINNRFISSLFINFLQQNNLWDTDKLVYSFGNCSRVSKAMKLTEIPDFQNKFISNSWQTHNIVLLANSSTLWDSEQEQAIDFGNLIHEIFSKIYNEDDVDDVLKSFLNKGLINDYQSINLKKQIDKIVYHPELNQYYKNNLKVYNEKEIVDEDNRIIIPDRLVFDTDDKVTIIDYKTGVQLKKHYHQILNYSKVLESMNFTINSRLLVYIDNNIDVVEV